MNTDVKPNESSESKSSESVTIPCMRCAGQGTVSEYVRENGEKKFRKTVCIACEGEGTVTVKVGDGVDIKKALKSIKNPSWVVVPGVKANRLTRRAYASSKQTALRLKRARAETKRLNKELAQET